MLKRFLFSLLLALATCVSTMAGELTVYEGLDTHDIAPICPRATNYNTYHTQYVIVASELIGLNVGNVFLTGITYYLNEELTASPGCTIEVRLMDATGLTFDGTAQVDVSSATLVYSGPFVVENGMWRCREFDNEYPWTGGPLLVDIRNVDNAGSFGTSNTYFYGVSDDNFCATTISGSARQYKFVPKTTLQYTAASSCAKPTTIPVVTNVTDHEATVTWGAAEGVSGYEYCVAAGDALPDWSTASSTTATSVSLSELIPNTKYYVYVRSYDSNNEKSWRVKSEMFRTDCGVYTIANGAYRQYFDDSDLYIHSTYGDHNITEKTCLTLSNGTQFSLYYEALYSYQYYSKRSSYMVLPEVTDNVSGLMLQMYLEGNGTASSDNCYITIGVMSDPTDTTTFTEVTTIQAQTNSFVRREIYLDSYTGTGKYVAMRFDPGQCTSNYMCGIDNLVLAPIPVCKNPTDLHFVSAGMTDAVFAWNGTDQSYHVHVTHGKEVLYDGIVNEEQVTVTGLRSGTCYVDMTVSVKAVNGSDESEETIIQQTLTTECQPTMSLPWSEDFQRMPVDQHAPCWDYSASTTASVNSQYVWGVFYHYMVSTMLRMNNSSAQAGSAIVRTPSIVLPADEPALLSFKYAHTANCGDMVVRISADGGETFTTLGSYGNTTTSTNYYYPGDLYTREIYLNQYAGQTVIISFEAEANRGEGAIWIDDLSVMASSCHHPINIRFESSTPTTATFAWDGLLDNYYVEIRDTTRNDSLIYQGTVSSKQVMVTGLQPGSRYHYSVSVKSLSGSTQSDMATETIVFTTECVPVTTLPFTEDFETTDNYEVPLCWDIIGPAGSTRSEEQGYVWYGHISLSLRTLSKGHSFAVLPEIAADLTRAEICFTYKMDYDNYDMMLDLGYITDMDTASFVTIRNCAFTTTYSDSIIALTGVPQGARIAFRYGAGTNSVDRLRYLNLDNVKVRQMPACRPGTDLHAVDSLKTPTSVTFAWSPYAANNKNAHVIVKNGDELLYETDINDTVFTVNGLMPSTRYELSVEIFTIYRQVLSEESLKGTLIMDTECGPVSVGWYEDFSKGTPPCWILPIYRAHHLGNGYFSYKDTVPGLLIMPEMENLAGNMLTFYQTSDGPRSSIVEVGYLTDVTDANSFVQLLECERYESYSAMYEEVRFDSELPAGARMAFRFSRGQVRYSDNISLRNVRLVAQPACLRPLHIDIDRTPTMAEIHWDSNAALGDSVIIYSGSDTLYRGLTTERKYEMELIPGKNYSFYVSVKAIESATVQSDYSTRLFRFTADCMVWSAPWSDDFERGAAYCWTLPYGVSVEKPADQDASQYVLKFATTSPSVAVLPEMEALNGNMLIFGHRSWWSNYAEQTGVFHAGYVTDPSDPSTFVAISTRATRSAEYEEVFASFDNVPEGARAAISYSGSTYSSSPAYVDNVRLVAQPASLTLTQTDEWGTVVLPFDLIYDADNTEYNLYDLTAVSGNTFTFTEWESDTIPSGTPMAVKALGQKNDDDEYVLTFSAFGSWRDLLTEKTLGTDIRFYGTFLPLQYRGGYYMTDNEMRLAASSVDIEPYRCMVDMPLTGEVVINYEIVEYGSGSPTGLDALGAGHSATKLIIDGRLFILLPDGTAYDALGRKVE